MPNYQIAKMWNSENGKGVSVLLADNMAEDSDDNECKCGSCKWLGLPAGYEPCCFCGRSSNWCKFEPKFMAEDSDEKPKRKFIRIVARYFPNVCYKEYVGKPYFSIEYEGDGELHCGYGTYDIDVLSSYLRDYFMAEKEENDK